MSIEANKAVAREFMEALSRADGKRVMELYAPDAICWTAGTLPFSGEHRLDEIGPLMEGILGAFPEGLRFTVRQMTAEGERVAIEAESFGRHVSGKTYRNQYHFLMVIRDGRIHEFKEYMDTMHAKEVLVDAAPQA
ncbi:MAG: nuclear transport factor 2 family protein [Myxococcota bacterium]